MVDHRKDNSSEKQANDEERAGLLDISSATDDEPQGFVAQQLRKMVSAGAVRVLMAVLATTAWMLVSSALIVLNRYLFASVVILCGMHASGCVGPGWGAQGACIDGRLQPRSDTTRQLVMHRPACSCIGR